MSLVKGEGSFRIKEKRLHCRVVVAANLVGVVAVGFVVEQ